MKKIIVLILIVFAATLAKGQGFPGTDSLRTYNIKYVTNNPATAFTNLRLHTLLRGIIDWIDTARAGTGGGGALGVDTLYALNDSTIRSRRNGVWTNTILRGVYDTRRKVDTVYAVNDTTLRITINGQVRNIIIPGRGQNLANSSLTANGDYTHSWAQKQLYIDSIRMLRLMSYGPDDDLPSNIHKFSFTTDNAFNGDPIDLKWSLRNQVNDADSVGFQMLSVKNSTIFQHYGNQGNRLAYLEIIGDNANPRLSMQTYDGFNSSTFSFGKTTTLSPADSLRLKLQAASAATHFTGLRANSSGVWTPVAVDISAIAGTPTILNNVGTGYAWATTPNGSIKRFNPTYGLIADSATSNTNSLKADTTSTNHLITQSDLNDAIGGVTSGINQLTGDVTAGPGSGSQAATIAANAVSNSKFRQSVANSVVGRASNSTGNVADIQATVTNTQLQYNGTDVVWDSTDYAHLKNKPDIQNPGVYFAPAESYDPSFVVFASAIVIPTNSFSHGATIAWGILDHASGHNSSFYDTAYGDGGTQRLVIRYPNVKNVLNSKILPDESFAEQILSIGASVGFTSLSAPVYQWRTVGIRLSGAGSSTWTKNGVASSAWDVTTYNTGDGTTSFNVTSTGIDYDQIAINYNGPNGYHIRRYYSGLGAYNVKFALLDALGNPVTSNPTTSDDVTITGAGLIARQIGMATYSAGNNDFMGTFTNWWVDGAFECWMVSAPVSTSSIQVRWQPVYPSATNYKIYRATSLYGTRTLIHTGTDGRYTDSGLSADTEYWYFMEAVIGGVDTYITYFRTNTKAF